MEIKEYSNFDLPEIIDLYAAVGWTNYTARPEMIERAFKNSILTLGAYENDCLIGFIRAVGDGASIVFVQDIVVHPEYQRKKIGTALVKELLARYPDVYQIELMTDDTEKTVKFYKSLGFDDARDFGCAAFVRIRGSNT